MVLSRKPNALLLLVGSLTHEQEFVARVRRRVRERLQKQFAPEVERLDELLGWDLTHWCDVKETS